MSEIPSIDNLATSLSVTDADTDQSSPGTTKDRHSASHVKGHAIGHTLFILVLMAGIAVGGYFAWHRLDVAQQKLEADATSVKQQLAALIGRNEQLERQVEALPGAMTALQTKQQALEDAVNSLDSEALDGIRTWDVAEIAALLRLANDRLHLEGDVAIALEALKAADHRIETMNNPAFIEIRRLLAEEITALRAIPAPDITGMALSLGALIEGIDHLPVIGGVGTKEQTAHTISAPGWRGLLDNFWLEIRSLVIIKRRSDADRALLAPDERYFLTQNLRLTLESAHNALIRRDRQTYQQTLGSARIWIDRYFDNTTPAVAATLKEINRLQQIDIAPNLPDISGSLNALHSWLTRQKIHRNKATHP